MSIKNRLQNKLEQDFFDHIFKQHGSIHDGPNAEATAIFNAIQRLYDGLEGQIVIDAGLLHNLAACGWVALLYNADQPIPWDTGEHDYIILRAFRGLMQTLGDAIREDRIKKRSSGTYYGQFKIPDFFLEEIRLMNAKPVH